MSNIPLDLQSVGCQIFATSRTDLKSIASKAGSTARRARQRQKKNPPGWVDEIEICPSGVSSFRACSSRWRSCAVGCLFNPQMDP
jgi:hypothetical protein